MKAFLQEPTFIPGKRKYLFCANQKGIGIFQKIIEKMQEANLAYEVRFIDEFTDLSHWLREQKMGSYLYAAAPFEQLKFICHLAQTIGFTNEEAQFIGYGVEKRNVFCCRCHGITEVEIHTQASSEMKCLHCDLLLSVSDHYSSLRDAYLGYVAKL